MEHFNKPCLAIFDFDKTITIKDSFNDFFIIHFGIVRFLLFMFKNSPFIILYVFGFLENYVIKERMLSHYCKNMSYNEFLEKCNYYAENHLPRLINKKCIDKIMWHKKSNHELAILSASPSGWIEPWAKRNGFSYVICTKMEIVNNKITGKIGKENNCYGKNKLLFLENTFKDITSYYTYAYGDSVSDKYFLDLADESFYRKFN